MSSITAEVTGVVLNLAVWFGMQILFPFSWGVDLFSAAVGIAAFIAIQKLKIDLKAAVVARAAVAGFTLREYGRDHYSRVLAVVFLNGTNINLEMVKAGLAEVYQGTPAPGFDNEPYLKAEREAQAAGREMWVQGDKYVSPRQWRNKRGQ